MQASLAVVPLVGALVAVRRYRRFGPEQRLQMKWPMAGAIPLALTPAFDPLLNAGAVPFGIGDADEIVAMVVCRAPSRSASCAHSCSTSRASCAAAALTPCC